MFNECVQNVYNARGPKLNAKEVVRLQTALLDFSMKCYKGNLEQITLCLRNCVVSLQQARDNASSMQMAMSDSNFNTNINMPQQQQLAATLDPVATKELEKLLSIPLDELAMGVLKLDFYSDLIACLPWNNRRGVAVMMLKAVVGTSDGGKVPDTVKEIEELFTVIAPVLRGEYDMVPTSRSVNDSGVDQTTTLMAQLGVFTQQQQPVNDSYSGVDPIQYEQETALVAKLIGMINDSDTDALFQMLITVSNHLNTSRGASTAHAALVFASLKLARRIFDEQRQEVSDNSHEKEQAEDAACVETNVEGKKTNKDDATMDNEDGEEEETKNTTDETRDDEIKNKCDATKDDSTEETDENVTGQVTKPPAKEDTKPPGKEVIEPGESKSKNAAPKKISCRKVFVFIQQTISAFAQSCPDRGIKLYLEAALTSDKIGSGFLEGSDDRIIYGSITFELFSQSFLLYEKYVMADSRIQCRCVTFVIATLLACRSLAKKEYEELIMKTSKFAAKMIKISEQCEMVTRCAHLFYVIGDDDEQVVYANPQRCLECLQRALKLADSCNNADPSNLKLFVDLLDVYLYFFEEKNPSVTGNYITGLVALIKEQAKSSCNQYGQISPAISGAQSHFLQIVRHIKEMKEKETSSEYFNNIDVSAVVT